jgi:hypothetical protein
VGDACQRCVEPSALDQRPGATPLLVTKSGANLALTWEVLALQGYDVPGGRIAALRQGTYDHVSIGACNMSGSAAMITPEPSGTYYLVQGRGGIARSSLGRDSFAAQRPAPAVPCP